MKQLNRYKQNLHIHGLEVYSYDTLVATIDYQKNTLTQFGYWSQTTQKHINYVADELELKLLDRELR